MLANTFPTNDFPVGVAEGAIIVGIGVVVTEITLLLLVSSLVASTLPLVAVGVVVSSSNGCISRMAPLLVADGCELGDGVGVGV